MSSFTKDTTHYAHPLFQSNELPKPIAKKNKAPNKKLPTWMTHTVKQGYTSYLVHTNVTTLEPKDYRPPKHVGGLEPAGNQFELFEDSNDLEEFEPSGASEQQVEVAKDIIKRLENNNEKGAIVLKKKLKKIVADYKKKKSHTTKFSQPDYLMEKTKSEDPEKDKEANENKLKKLGLKDKDLIYDIINFKKLVQAFRPGDDLSETRKRVKEKQQKEKKKKKDREPSNWTPIHDRKTESGAYLSKEMKDKVEARVYGERRERWIKNCMRKGGDRTECEKELDEKIKEAGKEIEKKGGGDK